MSNCAAFQMASPTNTTSAAVAGVPTTVQNQDQLRVDYSGPTLHFDCTRGAIDFEAILKAFQASCPQAAQPQPALAATFNIEEICRRVICELAVKWALPKHETQVADVPISRHAFHKDIRAIRAAVTHARAASTRTSGDNTQEVCADFDDIETKLEKLETLVDTKCT